MFSYKPLFKLLIERGLTKTELRQAVGFGSRQLANMSKGNYIALETLDKICNYLDCRIEDIIEYIPDNPTVDTASANTEPEEQT